MSRTHRRAIHRNRSWKEYSAGPGKVRDGSPTRYAGSCQNHGGCKYCYNNRMHKHRRKGSLFDELCESLEQLAEIERGERQPSRTFHKTI